MCQGGNNVHGDEFPIPDLNVLLKGEITTRKKVYRGFEREHFNKILVDEEIPGNELLAWPF